MLDSEPGKALSVAGAQAASLLEIACASAPEPGDSLQLDVVRDLARDLKTFLEETFQTNVRDVTKPDLLAETALRCADLANLAACNVCHLSEEHRSQAVATVHLASGTVKALNTLAEAEVEKLENSVAENVSRDLRSAGWRADLAVRQVDERVK